MKLGGAMLLEPAPSDTCALIVPRTGISLYFAITVERRSSLGMSQLRWRWFDFEPLPQPGPT